MPIFQVQIEGVQPIEDHFTLEAKDIEEAQAAVTEIMKDKSVLDLTNVGSPEFEPMHIEEDPDATYSDMDAESWVKDA